MQFNNLKIAFRSLLRRKTISVINIAGLGLGMAAAIFTFLWVQNEFSFDRYHQHVENMYRINTDIQVSNGETWYWSTTPLPLQELLETEVPEVIRTASSFTNQWAVPILKKNATVLGAKKYTYLSKDWFELFDHKFISGSAAGFQDNLKSAILTRELAEKLFGRWDVAGETFLQDTTEFVVQAVVENHPPNSGFTHELMLSLSYFRSTHKEEQPWTNFNFVTFVELRPDADLAALNKKLTAIIRKHKDDETIKLSLAPLASLHFEEERSYSAMRTGNRQTTYTFGIIGLIILFLACVNYVSLTTAQAGMRAKDLSVRKIIGAGGPRIFRMLFTESLVTALLALLLALFTVHVTLPLFNNFTEKNFQLDPSNPVLWMVTGGTLLATLLLSGLYPAFFLMGFSPNNFLRGNNFLKMGNGAFRKSLVVVQFALTVGLIIGALVIFQQQDFIRKKDLGYDRSHIFEFQVPFSINRVETVQTIRQALAGSPSILGTAVSNASIIDMESFHSGSLDWDGKPEDFVPTVSQLSVDPDFDKLVQLPLVEGRWFLSGNETDQNNVVLNEAAVRLFQMPEPVVGQKIHFQGRGGQVIGIVKDFHYRSLRQKIEPLVLSYAPLSNGNCLVKTAGGQTSEAIATAQAAWTTHFPNQPFEYAFMDDSFDKLYKSEEKNASLFKLLAGLAIFISCLGLFGLALFSTEQRTKEIGVRKVLGATTVGLVGLLSKDFLKLVLVALLIATPLAWYFMQKWLADFAYRINISWWVFALAGFVAIGVAFLTVGFQSVKAALANPVDSLRSE